MRLGEAVVQFAHWTVVMATHKTEDLEEWGVVRDSVWQGHDNVRSRHNALHRECGEKRNLGYEMRTVYGSIVGTLWRTH